jgi:uncharacterized protein DUF3226
MAERPKLENYDRVLAVEGYSDLLFYAEVLEMVGKNDQVYIKEFNGRSDLDTKLETFLTPQLLATKQSIGVIVDCDTNGEQTARRFQTLLSRLTNQAVTVGNWTVGPPRVGFLVVPDVSRTGEIETLVWDAWSNDPLNASAKACVDDYFACMDRMNLRCRSREKGLVSALLAIRHDEDPRLGPGTRAKVFDLSRPEFQNLSRFLSGI